MVQQASILPNKNFDTCIRKALSGRIPFLTLTVVQSKILKLPTTTVLWSPTAASTYSWITAVVASSPI